MENTYQKVSLLPCECYDLSELEGVIKASLDSVLDNVKLSGKKIVIKPNLVSGMPSERAATTHPAMLEATVNILRSMGADDIIIAESPGGPYTKSSLKRIYSACGITNTAERLGVELNYDTDFVKVSAPDGVVCRSFNIIKPIAECDIIVNLCRLKTHSLTLLSCAVKNFFGVIPGVQKFEMHAEYPELERFSDMLVDLCHMLAQNKTLINICDAVVGMEGNGPTGGKARKMGYVISSLSPFCLDRCAESLICFDGETVMLQKASQRSLCPSSADELEIVGCEIGKCRIDGVVRPDSQNKKSLIKFALTLGNGKFAKLFEARPEVMQRKCLACGVCVASCPKNTIEVVKKGKRRVAKINTDNCIRCYCCQELCPYHAIKTHTNFIVRTVR
jgi:uncharacterized protein (DUF362 family)/Pyruvate/2-oxoacid:ferredoxin oxidoreductase delta subunit